MSMNVLSVSQITGYLKSLLEGDPHLNPVFISGEISNFTDHYRSGHLYFSLKDEKAVLKAVMFSSSARRLRFRPSDGMKVLCRGRISLYEASGQYQLYVDDMQPDGLGALNLAYEQLKARLEKEGLFDAARKRPIPRYPRRVGVITSPTGAAVRDICQILGRRWPMAEIVFCPVLVQGEGAAPQLVEALARMNRIDGIDTIIIGRGGGSLEDLWAFNEENVARAVAASKIPVISAVGHETDFTICDFVADLRAPTPSAAAELAVPDQMEEKMLVDSAWYTLKTDLNGLLSRKKLELDSLTARRCLREPLEPVRREKDELEHLTRRLTVGVSLSVSRGKEELSRLTGMLDGLSPLKVLSRGYTLAQTEAGEPIRSVSELQEGETFRLRFMDGEARCVRRTEKEEPDES